MSSHLVNRIIGESKLERQLATQLLAVRCEKDFLVENRRRLEMEFNAQRARQAEEEQERQNEIDRLQQEQTETMIAIKLKAHRNLLEEKRTITKQKHTDFCASLVRNMIDMAIMVHTLNVKTNSHIPAKLEAELKQTFVAGERLEKGPDPEPVKRILNEADYHSYSSQTDHWKPMSDDNEPKLAITNCILERFKEQVIF